MGTKKTGGGGGVGGEGGEGGEGGLGTCSPGDGNWDCCSESQKCSEGGGDCDYDVDCAPGLVCGDDNCGDFYLGADSTMDCCMKKTGGGGGVGGEGGEGGEGGLGTCSPGDGNWDCCSESHKCSEGGGDCDYDSHCLDGLHCGDDNCIHFNSDSDPTMDCCVGNGP